MSDFGTSMNAGTSARPRQLPIQEERSMRVLHVAESTCGGVGSYLEEIADFQSDQLGADNLRFLVPGEANSAFRRSLRTGQVATFSRDGRGLRSLAALAQMTAREIHGFRPSVVHLHSTFAGAVGRSWIRLTGRRVKTIYCPHGWSFGMDIAAKKKRAYAALERTLCRTTDLVVLNSESERRLAQEFAVTGREMVVIPNGVAPHGDGAGAAARPKAGRLRLGFIGRFDPQKGLDLLLEAFRKAARPDLELHVVGAEVAGGSMLASLRQHEDIINHGWLPRSEVFSLVAGLDAVVMPSRWEAMPLVALEAMQLGVPVIGSDRGGIPEIVRHGRDGLIFSLDDPDALSAILKTVTRAQLAAYGASSRARYVESFTADKMNNDLLSAYRALAGEDLRDAARQPVLGRG